LLFIPITIELSLVDNLLDPIIYTNVTDPGDGTRIANSFYTNVTSNMWSILNVQAKADLVTRDKSFEKVFINQ